MRSAKNTLLGLIISAFVLIQLANPTSVYADGEIESPPTDTAETIPPEPESTDTTEIIAEEVVLEEEVVLAEVLEEIPENTGVVVLDENNQPVPLATQEAAEIAITGDPVWCPTGQNPGGVGCSGSYGNLQDLIADVGVGLPEPTVDGGVIWIQFGADTSAVVNFNGASWTTWNLLPLKLQGGWNGPPDSLGTITATNSVFSVPVIIQNWQGNVTVNNIKVSGVTGDGLSVSTTQDIYINDSEFSGNTNYGITADSTITINNSDFNNNKVGAYLTGIAANVTITGNSFNSNTINGLQVDTAGNVNLTNSTFSGNGVGAYFLTVSDVSVAGSTFTGDSLTVGVANNIDINNSIFRSGGNAYLYDSTNVTISGSTFTGSSVNGAKIETISNNVTIANSTFNGNTQYGVWVNGAQNIAVSGSFFNSNVNYGAYIESVNNISITGSAFNENINHHGLYIKTANNVDIINSTFSKNARNGVNVKQAKNIFISGGTLSGNGYNGAYIESVNDVIISGSTNNNNGGNGIAIIDANDVSIVNSQFNGNTWNTSDGYYAVGAGIGTANHVTISNSSFNENNIGAQVYDVKSASITGSTFNGNFEGLYVRLTTGVNNITISNSTFNGNAYGIDAVADPGATINMTIDCGNVSYQNNGMNLFVEGNVIVNLCGGGDAREKPVEPDRHASVSVPPKQEIFEFIMDCSLYDSYLVKWASGDQLLLSCVAGGKARISRVDNTALPKDLPAGFEYATAFKVEISQKDVPLGVMPAAGYIQFAFSSRHENPQYGIMYWDEESGDWALLKDFQMGVDGASVTFPLDPSNHQDEYRILRGADYVAEKEQPHEEVTTNFTGIFVLTQY